MTSDTATRRKMVSDTSAEHTTPLYIVPVLQPKPNAEYNKSQYKVLHSIVTQSPNPDLCDTDIVTNIEAFHGPNNQCLWRRVVVKTGPSSPKEVIHASFVLPNGDPLVLNDHIACWADFPGRPNHKLLCVLGSPTVLYIWDVYPKNEATDLAGEGHSVHLPFEACTIHPIGNGLGLLIQRTDSMEDHITFDLSNKAWTSSNALYTEEEEDGFFLRPPPRTLRLAEIPGETAGGHTPAASSVPSLFSLSHPLDDVLPITLLSASDIQLGAVADVFEKILFVGTLQWADDQCGIVKGYSQPICVSYHTQRQRHAIWEMKSAPPPPPQAPLWQISQHWRDENGWNSHLGLLQQDMEDKELLGMSTIDNSRYDITTHNEALADALGVRKTPRKAVEDVSSRGRVGTSKAKGRNGVGASSTKASLLSPLSRHLNDYQPMDTDISTDNSITKPNNFFSVGPFASLHPEYALKCIYEEQSTSEQAVNVFLATNADSNGKLVVCLVCPNQGSNNPCTLVMLPVTAKTNNKNLEKPQPSSETVIPNYGYSFTVTNSHPPQPCISAEPIQTSLIPPCFWSNKRHSNEDSLDIMVTDILLLTCGSSKESELFLQREFVKYSQCNVKTDFISAFTSGKEFKIASLANPVDNRIDVHCSNESQQEFCFRGCISTSMKSNEICEKILLCIDASLYSSACTIAKPHSIELALKIRADCVRLCQALQFTQLPHSATTIDVHFVAVSVVLRAIFAKGRDNKFLESVITSSSSFDKVSSAWDQLLISDLHETYAIDDMGLLLFNDDGDDNETQQSSDVCFDKKIDHKALDCLIDIGSLSVPCLTSDKHGVSGQIFVGLHFLYEEYKLSVNSRSELAMEFLGSILGQFCVNEERYISQSSSITSNVYSQFLDHYQRDLGAQWLSRQKRRANFHRTECIGVSKVIDLSTPPCFLSWFDNSLRGVSDNSAYNTHNRQSINAICIKTRSLLRIFKYLFVGVSNEGYDKKVQRERDVMVVTALIEEGFTDLFMLRDELPAGVATPLLEVLHRCRADPILAGRVELNAQCWNLIGRSDLSRKTDNNMEGGWQRSSQHITIKGNVRNNTKNNNNSPSGSGGSEEEHKTFTDKDKDGIVPLELTASMLFPNDNRLKEVGRLLRSSRPSFLSVPRAIEVSDHDYERMKQDKLLLLSRRVLALPLGRGMFTIGNLDPVPAEPLPLPDLCLVGRVPPTNALLALDTSECRSDMKVWPEFHNGVAAGLRLPSVDAKNIIADITRTWIVYNRPPKTSQRNSQSNSNNSNHLQQNLGNAHGGLLMALGLRGHLTALEMTDLFDYLTQGTVTTTVGVLLGMAANKRGSCDISVSKMLCLHIPSLIPQHFSSIDVASPVQAAAIAGTGLLFQGSSHRMMTEFLLNEIGKRPSSDVNAFDRDAYTLSCGIALGMVNLCQGSRLKDDNSGSDGLADLHIENRLHRYVVGGLDDTEMRRRREEGDRLSLPSSVGANSNEKCSCVFEGELINTDVTAPGATLALGLIYMKSGNKTIAAAIGLPDTHFLLEYVRPDLLMLRVIARALILWDEVEASRSWINRQLPLVVRWAYREMREIAKRNAGMSGYPETDFDRLDYCDDIDNKDNQHKGRDDQEYDRQAIRQIYTHVIAGACFSLGLRYAGTGHKDAADAIFQRVMELRELRDSNDPVSAALRPAVPVLEMCLGCTSISLAMVLAGTGDLETLKLFKMLRWRCDEDVNYGTHMTYGAAIGLLFLGGGGSTLGREPDDIAALLMALYPRYPTTTADNQYHLQALRNLYALAVKHREFRAVDVDTNESVFVPIEFHYNDNKLSPLKLTAPCMLYNTEETPCELQVASKRYYPLRLNIKSCLSGQTFWVKRRSAHLSYQQDPNSQRSLLVQTGSFGGGNLVDLISSFVDDPQIHAFAQYLCEASASNVIQNPFEVRSVGAFCTKVLHECLTLDTEEALPLYLALRGSLSVLSGSRLGSNRRIWDYRLIRSYYERRNQIVAVDRSSPPLLNIELVTYLIELVEQSLLNMEHATLFGNHNTVGAFYNITMAADTSIKQADSAEMDLGY